MLLYYLFYLLGCLFFICAILTCRHVTKYYKTAYKVMITDTSENTNGEITLTVKEPECTKK